MGHANSAKQHELDEFDHDYEADEDSLNIDLDFDDDIDSYLLSQDSEAEDLDETIGEGFKENRGVNSQPSHSSLPQDWQDFDYSDDDSLDDWE